MIRIMVVDDHTMFREGIVEKLSSQKEFEVICEAGTAKEALHFMEMLLPDMVILDLSLPDGNGLEVAQFILEKHPSCDIILLSMYRLPEILEQIQQMGVKGYVLKNDAYEVLLYAIKAVKKGCFFVSPSIHTEDNIQMFPISKIKPLSPQERRIIRFLAQGYTSKEIAAKLHLGVSTVETHKNNAMKKLGCRNSAQLISKAIRLGLILP